MGSSPYINDIAADRDENQATLKMRRAALFGLLLVVAGGYCSKLAPLLSEVATNALEGEYIVQLQDHLSEDEGT
ncbi:hypothetical protein EMCRGX_G010631 [Ephydatia muelleri]